MSRRVMIIGGSGFIGAYVAHSLLARGDEVVNFDLEEPGPKARFVLGEYAQDLIFEQGSCLYLSELMAAVQRHRIENIIHMAAIQDLDYANRHPMPVYALHVQGLLNLLETARLIDLGRIVVGSTTGAYTPRHYEPMDEAHPIYSVTTGHLTGHYGASKAAADIIAMSYWTTNQVDVVVARLSHVYGFGMWGTAYIRPAVENIVAGRPTHYETGSQALFDYTYVKDAARGVVLCLDAPESKLEQRVFLIAQGQLSSGADAVEALQQVAPDQEISIGPGMTERQRVSFRTELEISAAGRQLGYQPEFNLEQGIADFLAMQRAFAGRENMRSPDG